MLLMINDYKFVRSANQDDDDDDNFNECSNAILVEDAVVVRNTELVCGKSE